MLLGPGLFWLIPRPGCQDISLKMSKCPRAGGQGITKVCKIHRLSNMNKSVTKVSVEKNCSFIFGQHYHRAALQFMLIAHSHCTVSKLSQPQDLNIPKTHTETVTQSAFFLLGSIGTCDLCLNVPKTAVSLTFQISELLT